jgi:hypothetical protein
MLKRLGITFEAMPKAPKKTVNMRPNVGVLLFCFGDGRDDTIFPAHLVIRDTQTLAV